VETIETPGGTLTQRGAYNKFTGWLTEGCVKTKEDFEIWNKYVPVPERVTYEAITAAKKRIGDKGIVRTWPFDFGQGSPFQSFAAFYGTEQIIFAALDEPEWLHYVLQCILEKKLRAIEAGGQNLADLVETDGGAGSSTVISPAMHREFCLPYDIVQHKAIHASGPKIVFISFFSSGERKGQKVLGYSRGKLPPRDNVLIFNGVRDKEKTKKLYLGGLRTCPTYSRICCTRRIANMSRKLRAKKLTMAVAYSTEPAKAIAREFNDARARGEPEGFPRRSDFHRTKQNEKSLELRKARYCAGLKTATCGIMDMRLSLNTLFGIGGFMEQQGYTTNSMANGGGPAPPYSAAIYARFSKDDGDSGDSSSIKTQKMMLEKYCRDNSYRIYGFYKDDGYSGLNFDRSDFQRMLRDIEDGKVNLVITKDQSRLGRDYIMTGYVTEVVFGDRNVRYIAINDGGDTVNPANSDFMPLRNIINNLYSKDLSRKIRSAKRQRALSGKLGRPNVPYGYRRNNSIDGTG
jgi:DNA invertase Pin-like site-specific DNA recombinase